MIKQAEWTQSLWKTPGVSLQADKGDFFELSNLRVSDDRRQLLRVPAWASQVTTDDNGLADVQGMFYDHANSRVVLLGTDGSSDLSSAYLDSSWTLSANTQLHATPTNLGGLSMRNFSWWGGYLYLVGSDQKIYSGTAYDGALTQFDATTTHRILTHIDEHVYVVHDDGQIQHTNSDHSSFSWSADPESTIDVRWFGPFRSYGLAIARNAIGGLDFYRVELDVNNDYFNHIAGLEDAGTEPSYGCLYVLHNDHIYFSPGYTNTAESQIRLNVYRFTGSRVEYVGHITHDPNTGGSGFPTGAGFISWRGELIYYALEGTSQTFKILHGDRFHDFPTLSATATSYPIAAACGPILVANSGGGNEGVNYVQDATFSDGYVITSRLDMNAPGRQKRLESLTVLLNDAASNFKPIIKYRTDDSTSWTTAVTGNNSRRVTVADLAVTFYTLQIRVDLDDDTASNKDFRIDAISALYSIGDE
jgi:hypothetical protein